MKMQTGEKNTSVLFVASGLFRKAIVRNISTLHTAEWPSCCGLHGKTFRCKLDLNRHTKLHMGDKHVYSVCREVFIINPNLDSDVRTHIGGNYICVIHVLCTSHRKGP